MTQIVKYGNLQLPQVWRQNSKCIRYNFWCQTRLWARRTRLDTWREMGDEEEEAALKGIKVEAETKEVRGI